MKRTPEVINQANRRRKSATVLTAGLLLAFVLTVGTSLQAANPVSGDTPSKKVIRVGTAWADVTPSVNGLVLVGQMVPRYAEYTHDPLTVNAVVFEQDGNKVAMVSCDVVEFETSEPEKLQRLCGKEAGIPAASVLISAIHTHVAPSPDGSQADARFTTKFEEAVVDVVRRATADLEDVDLYAGKGFVEQMGFNRRGLYDDNGQIKSEMYYGSWKPNYIGVEGVRDGDVGVIFARNAKGELKVVIPNFSTHPNSLESDNFYSADIVGAIRNFIRRNLGEKVGVVYLTGAAGDTAPEIIDNNPTNDQPWRHEEGWTRSGLYLGSEIIKTIEGTIYPMKNPVLKFQHAIVRIPIMPWPKDFNIDDVKPSMKAMFQEAMKNWPNVIKEESPVPVHINVLRLGDAAICTNPAELYVEFGLDIKKKSPASVTLISELTGKSVLYVPTEIAVKHGGYSARPGLNCKLDKKAGKIIVDTTSRLLREEFAK